MKKLFLFALPILGTQLVTQLYNTVDIFFAGNFLSGTDAMAAVGASSMIVTLLVGFFGGLSLGSGIAIAHAYGMHDMQKLQRTVHSSIGISLLGGALLSVLGFFFSPLLLRWMQTPAEILDMASSYIQIYFLSVISLVVYNIATGILRACGDSRSPLLYQCIGGVLNILFDYLFLVVFPMGVTGIAVATLGSQTIPAILVLLQLMFTKKPYRLVLRKIRIHFDVLKKVLAVGVPAGVQSMVITLSNILVQSQINGFGPDTISAFTAYFRIELIIYLPIMAFGQAVTTFVGQNYGAGEFARARKGMGIGLLMGLGCTVLTSGFVMLLAPQCFAVFGANEAVTQIGLRFLYLNAALYFLYNFLEIFSAALRGSGDAVGPMIISIANMCGVRIGALFLMVFLFHDVLAVAACYPITWLTTSVCMAGYYLVKLLLEKKKMQRHKQESLGELLAAQ